MSASQLHIDNDTKLGANLIADGVAFRTWAPDALEVYRVRGAAGGLPNTYVKDPNDLLIKDANGYWAGFFSGMTDGDLYRFYVVGVGSEGFKRDPYARELEMRGDPWYPCNCVVCDPNLYRWHDVGFRPPAFNSHAAFAVLAPHSNGLSPDGCTLYVSEAETSRLWSHIVAAPGELRLQPFPSPNGGKLVHKLPDYQRFDSLSVEAIRSTLVLASREAGIDTDWSRVAQHKRRRRIRQLCALGKHLGFSRQAMHTRGSHRTDQPRFIALCREITRTQRIVDAFHEAEAKGSAAFVLDSALIDYTIVIQAERMLAAGQREPGPYK